MADLLAACGCGNHRADSDGSCTRAGGHRADCRKTCTNCRFHDCTHCAGCGACFGTPGWCGWPEEATDD